MVFLSISISMECGGGGDIAAIGAVHRGLLFTTSTLREQFWNILYFEVFRSTFLLTKYLISRFNITDLSVLRVDKIFIIINKRYYVESGRRIRATLSRVLQFWNRYCDDDEYTIFNKGSHTVLHMTRMGKLSPPDIKRRLLSVKILQQGTCASRILTEYCVFTTVSMPEEIRTIKLCRWR